MSIKVQLFVLVLVMFAAGLTLSSSAKRVDAQNLDLDVTTDIFINDDLSALVKTKITLENNNPSKLIGGYIYSVPFKYESISQLEFNTNTKAYIELNNDFNQVQVDFTSDTLKYKQSGILEIEYFVNEIAQESYDGFYEFYLPSIKFDEDIKSYITNIYTPSFFPSLSYLGSSSAVKTDYGVQLNTNENTYLVWADVYNVAFKQSFQAHPFSKINIASTKLNSYIFQNSIDASRAYLDQYSNAWAEFDFDTNAEVVYNFTKSNSAQSLPNAYDFSKYVSTESEYKSLEDIYQVYQQLIGNITVTQTYKNISEEAVANISNTKKASQLEICAYVVGLAQSQSYKGWIYYGYNTSKLLPTNNSTKPSIWCVLKDDNNTYLLDPILSKQSEVLLDPKSTINRIEFGVYASDNNMLGILDSESVNIEYLNSFEETKAELLLSLIVDEEVTSFDSFEALGYVKNYSSRAYSIDQFNIGSFSSNYKENMPIVMPFQDNYIPLDKITLGLPWESGDRVVNTSIEYENTVITQNNVRITLEKNYSVLFVLFALSLLVLILILITYARISLNASSKLKSRKSRY